MNAEPYFYLNNLIPQTDMFVNWKLKRRVVLINHYYDFNYEIEKFNFSGMKKKQEELWG